MVSEHDAIERVPVGWPTRSYFSAEASDSVALSSTRPGSSNQCARRRELRFPEILVCASDQAGRVDVDVAGHRQKTAAMDQIEKRAGAYSQKLIGLPFVANEESLSNRIEIAAHHSHA